MTKRVRCVFCTGVQSLSEERRETLYNAIFGITLVNGKPVKSSVISEVLDSWGIANTHFTIDRHRQKRYSKTCASLVENKWSTTDG